jgi:hypothetical protein
LAKAFLSHSSKQKQLVSNIANRVGLDNCVIDQFHFAAGEPTLDEIFKSIDKSDLFVLFLSADAIESQWVKREIALSTNLKNPEISRRLLILNIDRNLSYSDARIPGWLSEQYNLKFITDEIHLYKKVDSKLRDIAIEKYPDIKAKEDIFIGRNHLMDEFEGKYYNIDNTKPTCIVVSGFEEIGRRKFLNHALDKAKKLNKFHKNITITLDSRDSVEDFIMRIEDLNSKNLEEVIKSLKEIELDAKIRYAKELLLTFKQQNEILFIIDKGCIIQPNKHIAEWFEKVLTSSEFKNITVVAVIATIRPLHNQISDKRKYLCFHVNELTPNDTRILFIRYCNELYKLEPSKEVSEAILPLLSGMPGQVFYAANILANDGPAFITKKAEEIKKYNDIRVVSVIEQINKHGSAFNDMLVFLSKMGFVSFNTVYRIYGRSSEVEEILEKLFVLGVYDYIGIDKEYLQVHNAIADYISRAKLGLTDDTKLKLKAEMTKILSEQVDMPDISQILLTIKSMIDGGTSIPDKWLIPSFVLRSIIDSYYTGQYDRVEELVARVLGYQTRYDPSIQREIRYWLCQSLARKYVKKKKASHEKFFENVRFFEGADHFFLLGFYYRLLGNMKDAEKNFNSALSLDPKSQKSKRELVNILLINDKFDEAMAMAKDNYDRRPLNAFHIQAYFMCLTRKGNMSQRDKVEIEKLLESIKISHDFKAEEIYKCLLAEYKYYVENDLPGAIKMLEQLKSETEYKSYPRKALLEIYKRRGMRSAEQQIRDEIAQGSTMDTLLD